MKEPPLCFFCCELCYLFDFDGMRGPFVGQNCHVGKAARLKPCEVFECYWRFAALLSEAAL